MVTTPAPDDDVEKILTGIMAKQSPLMKQARTQGLQSAQTAGLGQSTMGIQASQAAAYNAAMPIASQQSQQIHQKGLQQAGFGQETAMQGREFGQQTALQGAQFGHESGMQGKQFSQAAHLAQLDRDQQTALANLQNQAELTRLHQATGLERGTLLQQQNFEASQKAQDRAMQERLVSMEISAADKERALSAMTQFNNSYQASYAQIAQNPDIPADARNAMLNYMGAIRDHNQNLTTSLYRYSVPW